MQRIVALLVAASLGGCAESTCRRAIVASVYEVSSPRMIDVSAHGRGEGAARGYEARTRDGAFTLSCAHHEERRCAGRGVTLPRGRALSSDGEPAGPHCVFVTLWSCDRVALDPAVITPHAPERPWAP